MQSWFSQGIAPNQKVRTHYPARLPEKGVRRLAAEPLLDFYALGN